MGTSTEQLLAMSICESPLPLSAPQARLRAIQLRRKHMLPYRALACILGEYHGVWVAPTTISGWCRDVGEPPRPRGTQEFLKRGNR